jgi:hypothetical protein
MLTEIVNDVHGPSTRFRVRGSSMLPTLQAGDEVIVNPVNLDDLTPGDLVFIKLGQESYIHRFLRRKHKGFITKGDGHRVEDPVWDETALRGRVSEAWRGDVRIYLRSPREIIKAQRLARKHRLLGLLWGHLRRMKTWLPFILCLLSPIIVIAAVTLAYFEVDPGEEAIFVYWETASEVGNLGFYLWRSEDQDAGFYKLPISNPGLQFIPSADEGAGAFYDYIDEEATPGVLYYYKVQDVPDTGSEGNYSQTLSGGIGVDTPTPTLTPSNTSTSTLTPTNTPTDTPSPQAVVPIVHFWTDKEALTAGECTTLQWQTENVKSVFLDGDGVQGFGAKTYCPCLDETHTLSVYFLDDTRKDYAIQLTVTGECGNGASSITPTVNPTATLTPTQETDLTVTETPTSQPIATLRRTTPPTATATEIAPVEPVLTPTPDMDDAADNSIPTPTSTTAYVLTPTMTRAIVEGQTPQKSVISTSTAVLLIAALIGCALLSLGIWIWRSR